MTRRWAAAVAFVALAACVGPTEQPRIASPAPVEVQVLAINDFHGNLEPPKISIDAALPDGNAVKVPAGGVSHLVSAARKLRGERPYTMTVSAGDMIGGSPLVSALYLDEPAIAAMELVGVDYNAVGNHEFDRGVAELKRIQQGGCDRHTSREPCAVEPYDGASFKFLAANVLTAGGSTLFPGTAIRDFGPVQVGIIGMTLKETATLVTPAGVAGVTFADEAATANAAIPALKAAGADTIVLLIHQGGRSKGGYNDKSCPGFSGDILPIIDRLDPAVDLVVSGHTHAAYVCDLPKAGRARPLLLTSAGRYGTLITDIRLTIDPTLGVTSHRADNIIVQNDGHGDVRPVAGFPAFGPDMAADVLIATYAQAAAPAAKRVVGRLAAPVTREETEDREQTAGNLIADSQLAAARGQGAQVAFINSGGIRTDLVPAADGTVTFGQIFAMQPFGNSIVVKTLTGAQLKAFLEQQFASGNKSAERPNMLLPSRGFSFSYDLSRPPGERIVAMRLDGQAIDPAARFRVAVNNFIASGGDNFTVLAQGADAADAGGDLDALEAWLKAGAKVPDIGRIRNLTPGG